MSWKTLDVEAMLREAGGGAVAAGATASGNAGAFAVPLGATGARVATGAQDDYDRKRRRRKNEDGDQRYYGGYESYESYQPSSIDWMLPSKV